jgi:murein L,D-transpeptidase YcbB/YkuD
MMELGLLFLILLSRASNRIFSPAAANASADDAAKKAADAAAAAAAAAAAGDHATAATKAQESAAHSQQAAQLQKAARTPPPWPQSVPADLPPFPAGWAPAAPVTSAIVSRAFQLLPTLWSFGEGTWKPEKTGASWVVYQARQMGEKRGVVAFTPIASSMPAAAPTAPSSAHAPTVTPGQPLPTTTIPAAAPGPTMPASTTAPPAFPTLRVGSSGPSVVWLQQHLGVAADGKFGPNTQHAVIAFQHAHGLAADGVVGPQTWAALGANSQAA